MFMVFNLRKKEWFFIGYWILKKGRFLSAFAFFRGIKPMSDLRAGDKLTDKRIFSQ
jgi:hypothetical protein